jgi:hypothetical protein
MDKIICPFSWTPHKFTSCGNFGNLWNLRNLLISFYVHTNKIVCLCINISFQVRVKSWRFTTVNVFAASQGWTQRTCLFGRQISSSSFILSMLLRKSSRCGSSAARSSGVGDRVHHLGCRLIIAE